jgi:malonate decarboxylase alpha subunit
MLTAEDIEAIQRRIVELQIEHRDLDVVIAQVNEMRGDLPRVDIPGDWVDFVVQAPTPNLIEPLFTRDPAAISEIQILMAMMAIKGIYAEYGVQRLNHGIGFDTAAIELILPTYGESLGLKGKICKHWALNPHPALIRWRLP